MIAIEENFSLRSFNTFGLPVRTRIFAEASSISDLQTLIGVFRDNPLPRLVLGGGSNLLFTKDFDGIVIYPNLQGTEVVKQDTNYIWVKASAGENWDQFVSLCVSNNWGGIENLSLIPGNVGACPVQNIGAYGVEAKDTIDSVEVLETGNGNIRHLSQSECEFGYRDSIFKHAAKNKYIIVSVTFKLSRAPVLKTDYKEVTGELSTYASVDIQTVREVIMKIRKRKLPDPAQLGNAGSFFKNPLVDDGAYQALRKKYPTIPSYPAGEGVHKIAAAWLIQQCGWKDKREGPVGTYEKQPLVLVNYGDAKGMDIYNFAKKIRQSVIDTFGLELEMEVNII